MKYSNDINYYCFIAASNSISPSGASVRNEYRLPISNSPAVDLNHRQLPEIPAPRFYLPKQLRREPPPPYWASHNHTPARRIPPPPPVRSLGHPTQRPGPSRFRDFYRESSGSESDTSNRREYRRNRPNISGVNTHSNECLLGMHFHQQKYNIFNHSITF